MEALGMTLSIILILIASIPAVLCIILFFKVWGMTNDVRKLTDTVQEWFDLEHPLIDDAEVDKNQKNSAGGQDSPLL